MLIECIHCYGMVSPSKDGTCPSCQRNINDPAGANTDLTGVEFVDGEKLPMFCITCASAASRLVEFSWPPAELVEEKKYFWAHLLGALGGVIALPVGPEKKAETMRLSIPVCEAHVGAWNLQPVRVYFDEHRMKFAVHKQFKAMLKRRK